MYFSSQKDRLYSWGLQHHGFIRYATTICVCIGLVLLWLVLISNRLDSVIDHYHLIDNLSLKEINTYKVARIKDIEMCKAINQLQLEVTALCTCGDDDLFQSDIESLISHSIGLQLYAPVKDKDKQWYAKHSVQLCFETDQEGIFTVLNGIQNSKSMLQCKECVLSKNSLGVYSCSCTIEQIKIKNALKSKALQLGKAEGLGG